MGLAYDGATAVVGPGARAPKRSRERNGRRQVLIRHAESDEQIVLERDSVVDADVSLVGCARLYRSRQVIVAYTGKRPGSRTRRIRHHGNQIQRYWIEGLRRNAVIRKRLPRGWIQN